ncbi:hypothetical protein L211DRAFT_863844 [Terfezia boudieri ATCC MYA-4762]|uniref:DDE Tnp4 domain-containing protein n=1 Tax=Terfezia boudieri ATCC MYA-4762 TaxID=1051890 RepID=A0A3N4L6T2_9PEZI|nr:hypothetical protein L211DRAFT_863844 [Terfezia boudieri ATCC MYA-4762]
MEECREYLRFTRSEIVQLVECFELDGYEFKTTMRVVRYPTTTWPTRLKDMIQVFKCSQSAISITVNCLIAYLYKRYQKKLEWDFRRLTLTQLRKYEATIARACPRIHGIWGFIDGTVLPIARPTANQEDFYSRHKGYYGIKYQGIITPDGLISSLYGPEFRLVGD